MVIIFKSYKASSLSSKQGSPTCPRRRSSMEASRHPHHCAWFQKDLNSSYCNDIWIYMTVTIHQNQRSKLLDECTRGLNSSLFSPSENSIDCSYPLKSQRNLNFELCVMWSVYTPIYSGFPINISRLIHPNRCVSIAWSRHEIFTSTWSQHEEES